MKQKKRKFTGKQFSHLEKAKFLQNQYFILGTAVYLMDNTTSSPCTELPVSLHEVLVNKWATKCYIAHFQASCLFQALFFFFFFTYICDPWPKWGGGRSWTDEGTFWNTNSVAHKEAALYKECICAFPSGDFKPASTICLIFKLGPDHSFPKPTFFCSKSAHGHRTMSSCMGG